MQVLETLIAHDQEQAVVLKLSAETVSKTNNLLNDREVLKATTHTSLQLQEILNPPYVHEGAYESQMFQVCIKSLLQTLQEMGLEKAAFKTEGSKEINVYRRNVKANAADWDGARWIDDQSLLITELSAALGISGKYERLLQSMLNALGTSGHIEIEKNRIVIPEAIKEELPGFDLSGAIGNLSKVHSGHRVHLELLSRCLSSLKKILTGELRATDVIFPEGSLAYVEGIYKGNYRADYFNELLTAEVAASIISAIGEKKDGDKFRIMEIGAGTGGTSELLFRKLAGYEASLVYVYTDISKSFLLHAERNYSAQAPYLQTALFNIEESPELQEIEVGSFDLVLGTNVVHATKNIGRTLSNIKAVLKKGGLLMLNEIARTDLYTTLTFGLLDGWWLSEDRELRLEGSPGLSAAGWTAVLAEQGFEQTKIYPEGSVLPQQVIIAESNGWITIPRRRPSSSPLSSSQPSSPVQLQAKQPLREEQPQAVQDSLNPGKSLRDRLELKVRGIASETIKLPEADFESDVPFTEYGFDSILGTTLMKNINEALNITLKSTDIFNYPNIKELSQYIHERYGKEINLPVTVPQAEPRPVETSVTASVKAVIADTVTRPRFISEIEGQPVVKEPAKTGDIAIVGLSGQFGAAGNAEEFWDALVKGKSLIEDVP
ncbi:hypothetical protein DBR43_33135, partial [Pedobacter sp. KBW06]